MRKLKKSNEINIMDYCKVKISLASPEMIRSWSNGEVTKPETINYRTFKPERDGLFCAKIFGPTQDYRCLCGKYKGMKYRGIICEKCGVDVTVAAVRRERMGHIELKAKVAHIWFYRGIPSRIGVLLELPSKEVERIVYYDKYIVLDPKNVPELKFKQVLSEQEYRELQEKFGSDSFRAETGAEALYEILKEIDFEKEISNLKSKIKTEKSLQRKKHWSRRLKLLEDFYKSNNRPEWMILSVIPVLPPDLRPLVRLDGGRFASSDLNDLYRRILNRNNRLKKMIDAHAPEMIIRNEKRMLQEAVDALFDNQKRARAYMSAAQKRPLKSLADALKGKQGRFRQNLLGKRVDYSGRSVIVVDPQLKLDECGLPKKMALELFKPFVYNRLEKKGLVSTLRVARNWVEEGRTEVWDALDEVIKEHTVLLNRAPTLHRLGIQAFRPRLIEGNAITLHPLVCPAFNADFDGDQMAVHVPLSLEAQAEAKILMLSSNNILSPANGKPLAVPSQDMILGFYYLTFSKRNLAGENMIFSSKKDVLYAYERGIVDLNSIIRLRYDGKVKNLDTYQLDNQDIINCPVTDFSTLQNKMLVTTPGRVIFNSLLPENIPFINGLMKKKGIQNLVYFIYLNLGFKDTVETLDRLKEAGFEYATIAGFTISISDLVVPDEKEEIVKKTEKEVEKVEKNYKEGLLTAGERHNKIIDLWSRTTDQIRELMFSRMKKMSYEGDTINPIFMMSDSGARGSKDQLKQLAGMRGLMAKPSGDILETPITANFKEGLSVIQYFISTHGARKGLADTALKTAEAGYLTRKMVDVAIEIIVQEEDCGTVNGVEVSAIIENGKEIESLYDRIVGRIALEDIASPDSNVVIVRANEEIDEYKAKTIIDSGIMKVKIRSLLTCETKNGVCCKCYGRNLSTGKMIEVGEAVGITAAQSIGEPGTQLTMRTFHIGGIGTSSEQRTELYSNFEGVVKFNNLKIIVNKEKEQIVMNRTGSIQIMDSKNREKAFYPVAYGSKLKVKDNQIVKKGDVLLEWDPFANSLLTDEEGIIEFKDLIENVSFINARDEATGKITPIVIDIKIEKLRDELHPAIVIRDKNSNKIKRKYYLPVNAHLSVKENDEVKAGDILFKTPSEFAKTKDITGGLPRVTELFEARRPKSPAQMAQIDGIVEFGKFQKGNRKIIIRPFDKNIKPDEHNIPRSAHIIVEDGEKVSAGTPLIDGPLNPVDILNVLGEMKLAEYLLKEIQNVYRLQGVEINDKHIEVIIKQMIKWRKIEEVGDTSFVPGQIVEKSKFEEENERVIANGGVPARAKPELLPISRAALATDSFLSAAAFQETTRILTDAAIAGKEDNLVGIKENVIMGRLIPAGTGFKYYHQMKIDAIEGKVKIAR